MIVMIVEFETDISHITDVPDLVPIEIEQKFDQFVYWQVGLVLSERNKGQDEGVLLSDLIDEEYLASGVSVAEVNERAWDGGEEEHVHEDEDDIVDVVGLVILNGQKLVVRIRVVGSGDVDQEDHLFQIDVVILILIEDDRIEWILIFRVECKGFATNKRITNNDDGKEDEVDQYIFVGRC